MKTLRLILGDQLNINHSWYKTLEPEVLYVMFELKQEQTYVKHHIQKVAAFFIAMRSFAEELQSRGHKLIYYKLERKDNFEKLTDALLHCISKHNIEKFEYQIPDEYRLDNELKEFCESLSIKSKAYDTEHFLTDRMQVKKMFSDKKMHLMESFYREMRKKYDLLMEGDKPIGDKWNYDSENRKAFDFKVSLPQKHFFKNSLKEIHNIFNELRIAYIGRLNSNELIWPTNREESFLVLNDFLLNKLKFFGKYEDAMIEEDFILFHSKLSFSLNTKLIHPLEVCEQTIHYWKENSNKIDIAQVEGFIRQIIGWREYVRGIYWEYMPNYKKMNFFEHNVKLPSWFWTGKTDMNCMKQCIGNSLDYAYAHHIQRLMVIGNFSLLAGIHPDEVDEWYLGVYADAIEWVQLPNTRGMSQFADGGIMGTKPYVSTSNYINKMSNYCKNCKYDNKTKTEKNSCPFNALYWNFHLKHRDKLSNNPRIGMVYNNLKKMSNSEIELIEEKSKNLIENIESL